MQGTFLLARPGETLARSAAALLLAGALASAQVPQGQRSVGRKGENARGSKVSYDSHQTRVELLKGRDLLRRNRTGPALTSLTTSLKSLEQAGDARGEASARDALGDLYAQHGQNRLALQEYRSGHELFAAANDVTNADLALAKLGDLYGRMNKGAEAAAAFARMKAAAPPAPVGAAGGPTAAAAAAPRPSTPPAAEEQRAFDLVNAERQAKGLTPLAWDDRLALMARSHAEDMARGGGRGHTDRAGLGMTARAEVFGVGGFEALGENIGYSEGDEDPVAVVLARWTGHDMHRQNILAPDFTHSGMGVAKAANGDVLFTQVFIARRPAARPTTPPPAAPGVTPTAEKADPYRAYILFLMREIGLGRVAFSGGRLDEAQRHFEAALASSAAGTVIGRLAEARRGRAVALTGLGDVAFGRGDYPEALRLYTEAGNGAAGDGRPDLSWAARRGAGRTLWAQAARETDPLAALRLRGDAVAAYGRAVDTIEGLLFGSFRSEEARGSFNATTQVVFEEASATLAEMALMTAPPTAAALEGVALTYGAAALQAAERGRSNALLELLGAAKAEITEGVPAELQSRKAETRARRNEIAELIAGVRLGGALTVAEAESLEAEAERLEAQHAETEARVRAANPRYAALTKPRPLTAGEIQQQVLDDGTALLEYGLGTDNSYLWVLTRDSLGLARLPARAVIEGKAQQFRTLLAQSGPPQAATTDDAPAAPAARGLTTPTVPNAAAVAPYAAAARELYRMLVEPAAPTVTGKRLLIAADGALHFIPFEALVTTGAGGGYGDLAYLVKSHEVVYAPSASVLGAIRQRAKGPAGRGQLLLVADPIFDAADPRAKQELARRGQPGESTQSLKLLSALEDLSRLPAKGRVKLPRLVGTRTEAERISGFAAASGKSAVTMLDFDASETGLSKQALGRYGVLHFATHGLLNAARPQFSGLALTPGRGQERDDGYLQVDEVFNLRLGDPLVMLSACETGLGELKRGDGVSGLTRAFMYAGAPTVGVSLWSVSDKATAELMSGFYKRLLAGEDSSASEALRASQLAMIAGGQFDAPFYWAPFVLVGDWR